MRAAGADRGAGADRCGVDRGAETFGAETLGAGAETLGGVYLGGVYFWATETPVTARKVSAIADAFPSLFIENLPHDLTLVFALTDSGPPA